MPFLRRRGVMASESDMRRHSRPDGGLTITKQQSRSGSSTNLPPPVESDADEPLPSPSVASFFNAPNEQLPRNSVSATSVATSSAESRRAASNDSRTNRSASPPSREETSKHSRFSMLRFRNASDSQLSARAKRHAETPPPVPRPPEIITTAPTAEFDPVPIHNALKRKPSRLRLMRRSGEEPRAAAHGSLKDLSKKDKRKTILDSFPGRHKNNVTFEEPNRPSTSTLPPAYGEEGGSSTALPVNRLSESSRSDASSGERVYGSTTTTTHTVHTTTTFFRLPRRKRKPVAPLFPLNHLPQKGKVPAGPDPMASSSTLASMSDAGQAGQRTPTRPSTHHSNSTPPVLSPSRALITKSSASPATALFRPSSRNSGASSPTRLPPHLRGRSSTLSSLGRDSVDEHLAPPTTRTSSSTGRKSFGDLLGLSRLRGNSDIGRHGSMTPMTPGSNTSKNNSLQIAREAIVLPERRDDDTPAKYLARLEEVVSRSVIAAAVSKGTDAFSQGVLRSYMRGFSFFGDPMDMSIRKLLMEAELPKETQQIDRCLQSFANRYHECNPGIYSSPDQAYFIAFSLLILHTDVFNKNNKHKMQKVDYLKNTRGEGIFDEVLGVFYDNITYTPFIHVEDDIDINGERIVAHKAKKKSIFPGGSPDATKKVAKEPVDPYTLIIDNRLDILRPNLKDVMHLEDHYNYIGTAKGLDLVELQRTFFKTGILQIVSSRSRPDAFMTEKTASNPDQAHPGIVDIKITKVGLLWRKDAKKKKTRSPWQEWGAILTGAQLYFFRNVSWIKSLIHQQEHHIKHGNDGIPVIFKPPLEQFKPDALISTDGAVALVDSAYRKHKNAFVYVRHGGFEEILLADDEEEMNDWLAKLNYAAAFRTSGVRMRGVVGSHYDGQSRRGMRRLDSEATQSVNTPTGEVTIARTRIDHKMAQDILAARREIIVQKIADADEKLQKEEKQLEEQLRNARHLQILAPIHPKTREQILSSAARMAAQLEWARKEIWRVKCHRDILVMDLEEERQLLSSSGASSKGPASPERPVLTPTESKPSSAIEQHSPRSPPQPSVTRSSTLTKAQSETDSPELDVFQTLPTSATGTGSAYHHKHQNSWEMPGLNVEMSSFRKRSISSAASSSHALGSTPPRIVRSPSPMQKDRAIHRGHSDEVDANERNLLAQAGFLRELPSQALESTTSVRSEEPEDSPEKKENEQANGSFGEKDKLDRRNIRRSLQRTIREGAGPFSHHRGRKGKDSASSGGLSDDTIRDDILSRGSGSFVVHGKKASVINIGEGLQSLSPDERLRQRKASYQDPSATTSPVGSPAGPVTGGGGDGPDGDILTLADSAEPRERERERRESIASASTATARSFRELHRKYSTAQQAAKISSAGTLTLPSDEDSDAAVSFSDGRRSPLPPIETESGEEDVDDEVGVGRENRQTAFFTPEPPYSPVFGPQTGREDGEDDGESGEEGEGEGAETNRDDDVELSPRQRPQQGSERLPSPALQAVGA